MKYDVVIIGSGLSGLQCGYILSKQGYKVCLLEQHTQTGGCLQTFRRRDALFDTGFHYVGGLEEGEPLNRLFRYFDLLDLPWQKMDEEGFAEVILDGQSFLLPSGYERFVAALSARFPHQQKQLQKYVEVLRSAEENIFRSFSGDASNAGLFARSAWEFLQETIDDPLLRQVLSGASLTMDLDKKSLPLYVFAQINNSFIRSSWRLKGGGSLVTEHLAESIRRNGGIILTHAKATRLFVSDERVTGVEYNGGERVEGTWFISTLHPTNTLSLLPENKLIRKIYRKRIGELPNTYGMFTTHLRLKRDKIPYQNRNIFIYQNQETWDYQPGNGAERLLVSYYPPEEGVYADRIDLLTPQCWSEVEQWANTTIGKRGGEYEAFKQQKATACIAAAAAHIPGLYDAIDKVYTSSPLTYRDYTGIPQGSAFGIKKDYTNVMGTLIPVQTQIPNLLLSGQSLNLHGVLGVSMTSFFTCMRIAGMDNLVREFITD
ncbi:NAD(P)/FAD-dependent oxidoreductase [Parabacteroides sp. OttesenSCG-928-G06]|nr:NAD(P)/FAD-dependent oxidoreductase [Parabacteroides sp. OttesenSCG-928-G06]